MSGLAELAPGSLEEELGGFGAKAASATPKEPVSVYLLDGPLLSSVYLHLGPTVKSARWKTDFC